MKNRRNDSGSIKKYLIVLILFFLVCSVLTELFFFRAIESISIESDLYRKIQSSSALKADIFPPTLYVVEADLLVQQILTEENREKQELLLAQIKQTRTQYFTYYDYWKKNLRDAELADLLEASHVHVTDFYRIYDESFLPAYARGDAAAMREAADSGMGPAFAEHREIIEQMSGIIDESKTATEKAAKAFADRATILLLVVSVLTVLIIIAISLIVLKKVTAIERDIVSSQHETALTNERLEAVVEGLRRFKHNYDNTLASIEGFAHGDDLSGLKAYLAEIIAEKSKNEAVNYFKLNFLDNPALTGLIISKMIYAEKREVSFVLKVRTDAAGIAIKQSHLCEILGILLDNAIEAAAESDGRKINLRMDESEDAFVFVIENTADATPEQPSLLGNGWTTKGEEHGYGLKIVNGILAGYENIVLNTTINEHSFLQELIVLKSSASETAPLFTDVL